MSMTLNINGTRREFDGDPDTPLLWVIRDELGLTGTKYGCGIAQCGACTVHVDGQALRSCRRGSVQAGARAKTTPTPISTMPATAIASIVSPNTSAAITAVDAGTRKKSRATFAAAPWRNNQ